MLDHAAERAIHFRRDYLTWVAVRHFLSADLLQELGRALVDVVAGGQATLEDLFDTTLTSGPPTLVTWVAQPRPVAGLLARSLQSLIKSLVWTGDEWVGSDVDGLAQDEVAILKALEAAFVAARLDFGSLDALRARKGFPAPLGFLLELIALVARTTEDDPGAGVDEVCAALEGRISTPLDAIVVKHLGDLCADADRWHLAGELYTRSAGLLPTGSDGPWSLLADFIRDVSIQSEAAARWNLEGPDAAGQVYDALLAASDRGSHQPTYLNAAIDAMNARLRSKSEAPTSDIRPVVALAPQLLESHDLASALSSWKEGEHRSAHGRFWATLRRQTALGSASESRRTKALYGSAIIDSLRSELGQHREPATFRMGVRLMVEGGREDVVNHVAWIERLVVENVDSDLLSQTLAHAHRTPGVAHERMRVVLSLFERWLEVLPRDATALAEAMLTVVAEAAGEAGDVNTSRLAGVALKALSEVAQARPEFLPLASGAITASIVRQLEHGGVMVAGDALQFAYAHVQAFDEVGLSVLADATLRCLEGFEPAQSPWPVVRPAIALLGSKRVLALCDRDAALKTRLPSVLVHFALGSESEYASLMYLLRDLDPSWLEERVDASRLHHVVGELRKRAGEINSSRSPEDVMALLVAPAFSEADGVRDALHALRRMVASGATDRPAISFGRAYKPVMLVSDERARLILEAQVPGDEVRGAADVIATELLGVWTKASQDPLVFAGFAIPPPSAPNSTLVHNWTFASLGLARFLGREEEMGKALDGAARHPQLRDAIAIARAVRGAAGDPQPFDVESIRREAKQPFYAAVGQRLMLSVDLPQPVRGEVTHALVEGCLRLGPHGLDAGAFLAAIVHGFDRALSADDVRTYGQRLENSAELRIGLSPLLESIKLKHRMT